MGNEKNAIAQKPMPEIPPIELLINKISSLDKEFAKVLPEYISAEKFCRFVITYIRTNPDLVQCTFPSIISAIMHAAQDGLMVDGKESAIIKRGKNTAPPNAPKKYISIATYMPMVEGLMKLVRNSGEVSSLTFGVIRQSEMESGAFKYWVDNDGEHLLYTPNFTSPLLPEDKDPVVLTFSLAKLKTGESSIEIVPESEMVHIKAASKSDVWKGPFVNQMRKKSVFKRHKKRLPASTDIDRFVESDDEAVRPDDESEHQHPTIANNVPANAPKVSALLASAVEASMEPQVEVANTEVPIDEVP